MTTGRQTIPHLLRTVRSHAQGPAASSHRVLAPRRWSSGDLARMVMAWLRTAVGPKGPVFLAGDETVAERPGPTVVGTGRHRAGGCSPHRYTASRWGPQWIVWSGLVTFPFAIRPGALPVVVAWARAPAWHQAPGTRQKTPAPLARLLLARVGRGLPARPLIVGGETGYGPSETARGCRTPGRHLPWGRTCSGAAAVDEPPPPRMRHTSGRPRVHGQKRAAPRAVVAHAAPRTSLRGAW